MPDAALTTDPPNLCLRLAPAAPTNTARFGPRSAYVEWCYLPILGPTTTWCYRRLGTLVASRGAIEVDLAALAQELGLSRGTGRHAPLRRSLSRLVTFGLARGEGDELWLAPSTPALAPRQLRRLTAQLATLEAELRQRSE